MTGRGANGAAVDLKPGRKWGLCAMLFLATTLNYLDRQTLSILAPTIQREMGFDNEALGVLFSIFYYTYTLSQFGVGLLLDRVNLRWAYGLAVLAWSAAAGLTGLAGSLFALMIFRGALGVAESANWPAAMRIVARALPPQDRTLGNGIFTSGTSVGALIAPLAVVAISSRYGWRPAFAVVGSLGAVWLAGWLFFTKPRVMELIWREERDPSERRESPWRAYRDVLGRPQFWRVFCVTILVNPCLYFNVNWLPTYFSQEWNVDDTASTYAFLLTAIYFGLDAGYLACGFSVMGLVKRGFTVRTARRIVFTAASLLMTAALVLPAAQQMEQAVALLIVVNFGSAVWISMYLTMAQEVSARHVSTAAGLLGGSGSFAGAIAMWGVGKATDATGSFAPAFIALAAAAVLAWLAGWNVGRGSDAAESPS